jgi:hypothetical protein
MSKNLTTTTTTSQFSLAPTNFEQLTTFAEMVANSTLVPKDYIGKPGNIIVAVQMGVEIGLKPMQALQNISVINGRPSLWGDSLLALVKASGVCEYIHEEISKDGQTAICETKRKGEPKSVVRKFSMDDARRAGLMGKDNWQKYPQRMVQHRARAWCLRDTYPDVLGGLQVAEEQEDKEYHDTQKAENAPKSLEQLGLKTIEKDGYLVVEGNTYGKTDFLKQLGFSYTTDGNVWRMEMPKKQEVIETSIQEQGDAETKKVEVEVQNEPKPQPTPPTINSLNELKEHIQFLGYELETKKANEKTFAKLSCSIEEASEDKEILNAIGFRFYKTKGVVMDITSLVTKTASHNDVETDTSDEVEEETAQNDATVAHVHYENEVQEPNVEGTHAAAAYSCTQEELPFD